MNLQYFCFLKCRKYYLVIALKTVSLSSLISNANKGADLPQETVTGMAVLEEVAKKMSIPKKTLSLYVPKHLLAVHNG